MKTAATTPYRELYESESAEIRRRFESDSNGFAAASARSSLVDRIIKGLFQDLVTTHDGLCDGFCIIALGGYGRATLFPWSDVDLLFLSSSDSVEESRKAELSTLTQTLWDMRWKLGNTSRTPAECGRLHRDNLEFNVGLLDARYITGDERLFTQLTRQVIPAFLKSSGSELASHLAVMTRKRHARFGSTIFHLEPNLKDSPGGLRDYNVAHWLARLSGQPPTAQDESVASAVERAFGFLATARTLLHYRLGRDDNRLSYEIQGEASHLAGEKATPEEYMRRYFRHARTIYRQTCAMLDRSSEQSRGRGSLLGMYQDWRSRLSNPDFAVVKDRIYVRQPGAVEDPALLLGLFELVARHGLALSGEAEIAVERALAELRPKEQGSALLFSGLWRRLRPILMLPHAAQALRSMHSLHVLTALFPEFAAVDCLVIRDFYHRYTVDEHTFQTIGALNALPGLKSQEGDQSDKLFAEILAELEQPELLSLALLLHDVGKGMGGDHVLGSLQAAESVFARLQLEQSDRATVRFLIKSHLEMSAMLQRRDIFDPETANALAAVTGTPERLKMLTLLTYADIKAVNPEALTPWKAEMLWRLYTVASGHMTRSVDDDRIPAQSETGFLAGFPRRYQAIHTSEEIAQHAEMSRDLPAHPVQVRIDKRAHGFDLTVVAADRPRLFARITGVLAAWGMSIMKADAFANAAGIVLDVFRFTDLYKTLELNPGEADRLRRDVIHVLQDKLDLESLLSSRRHPLAATPKVQVTSSIRFDQTSSSHSTLLEIVAPDRPGLLYDIATKIADSGCNIEVALIDTEGHKAIDVFYLTHNGSKLEPALERQLREKLGV